MPCRSPYSPAVDSTTPRIGVQATGREGGRNFGHVRIGDLDQPQVHGLGSLCQQCGILC